MIIEIEAEHQSDAGTTKHTPYLARTGELWGGVYFVNICEKTNRIITAPHCSTKLSTKLVSKPAFRFMIYI